MENIIASVDKEILENELRPEFFCRNTNFANNKIYIFTADKSPLLMQEVGRLRELAFRTAGAGTGKKADIDEYDLSDYPYKQLIVWNPEEKEIVGGYRFLESKNAKMGSNGIPELATARLFNFSEEFINNYFPYLIELGRSFVVPDKQATATSRKGLYTLDNLWDGLGALVVNNPDMKYFFGKVTMYQHYNKEARNTLLFFLNKYFGGYEKLISLIKPLELNMDNEYFSELFKGSNYEADYKILSKRVRELGENIPPLINAYMNLSSSMRVFGTSINPYFGNVEETAIMVTINDIYPQKTERHIQSYIK